MTCPHLYNVNCIFQKCKANSVHCRQDCLVYTVCTCALVMHNSTPFTDFQTGLEFEKYYHFYTQPRQKTEVKESPVTIALGVPASFDGWIFSHFH